MDMNQAVQEQLDCTRSKLEMLCKEFGVKRLWLFGSALTSNWEPDTSDLDLLVEFGPPPEGIDLFAQQFVFQVELENLFEMRVDLVERTAIKKQSFKQAVDREAREIYAA